MAAGESINQQAPRLAPLLCLCCELINKTPMLAEARGQGTLTVRWCRASGGGGGGRAVDPCWTQTCSLAASGQKLHPILYCFFPGMSEYLQNLRCLLAYCKQELVSNILERNWRVAAPIVSCLPWTRVQVVNKCYLIVPSKERPSRIECPASPPPPTAPFSLCGLFVGPLLCSSQRVKEGKVMSGPPGFHCVLALCHSIACRPQTHVQGTFLFFSPAQQLASNSTLTSFKSMQMLSKQQRKNLIADILCVWAPGSLK